MTDTRQVLEEAFAKVFPPPPNAHLGIDVPALEAHTQIVRRFRRFLGAEAWTDAAMMLVPEGWGWNVSQPNAKAIASGLLKKHTPVRGEVENGFEQRFIVAGETPALALAQACLKARENGDG